MTARKDGARPHPVPGVGVHVGDTLPPLRIPVTRTLIVAGAVASRDFQDVHHDAEAAREKGSPDIFMNILTTNGLVGRYVTGWAGPGARLRRVAVRLGVPNYPGDEMELTGQVTAVRGAGPGGADGSGTGPAGADAGVPDPAGAVTVTIAVTGRNRLGAHVTGTVEVECPPAPAHGRAPADDGTGAAVPVGRGGRGPRV